MYKRIPQTPLNTFKSENLYRQMDLKKKKATILKEALVKYWPGQTKKIDTLKVAK